MPKTHVSADSDLTITPPELRRIADYQGKPRTGAQGEIKALPAQTQDVGRLNVRYELAQSGGRKSAPVMLAVSFTPDEQSIRAIKLVAIDDVNLALDNARLHGGEWQAKFQRQGLIQYTEQEGEQEIIPISIDMIAVENGISCIIRSKYFTLTSLYRNKLNRFETFDYKELSDEEKTKQIHRPRDEWPDRCCQTNSNQSPLFANEQVLGDEKVAPFAKRGVSFLFESDSGVDAPFEVEVIVHR